MLKPLMDEVINAVDTAGDDVETFERDDADDRREALRRIVWARRLWDDEFEHRVQAIVEAKYGQRYYYAKDIELNLNMAGEGTVDCRVWISGCRGGGDSYDSSYSFPAAWLIEPNLNRIQAELAAERTQQERKKRQDDEAAQTARELGQLRYLQNKYGKTS